MRRSLAWSTFSPQRSLCHCPTIPPSRELSAAGCADVARFMLAGIDGPLLQELAKPNRDRSSRAIEALIGATQGFASGLSKNRKTQKASKICNAKVRTGHGIMVLEALGPLMQAESMRHSPIQLRHCAFLFRMLDSRVSTDLFSVGENARCRSTESSNAFCPASSVCFRPSMEPASS